MKKAAKLLRAASAGLSVMDEDITAVAQYSTLLCALTAAPDAEGCLSEMNRLLWQMVTHARQIEERRLVVIGRIEKAMAKLEEAKA